MEGPGMVPEEQRQIGAGSERRCEGGKQKLREVANLDPWDLKCARLWRESGGNTAAAHVLKELRAHGACNGACADTGRDSKHAVQQKLRATPASRPPLCSPWREFEGDRWPHLHNFPPVSALSTTALPKADDKQGLARLLYHLLAGAMVDLGFR
eukprot:3058489-Rhodomonas_salina.2